MAMRVLLPSQRLCVAADFKPPPTVAPGDRRNYAEKKLLTLADNLTGLGVYLKLNSALRLLGYQILLELHQRGLLSFADLKLFDIDDTLEIDGLFLAGYHPNLLTTVCATGVKGMQKLKAELPSTEVLGVTVLTSLLDSEVNMMFSCATEEAVLLFAGFAKEAGLDGLVSSAVHVQMLRAGFGTLMSLNTPAIRPKHTIVPGDGQNPANIMTPTKAIRLGADRIVVGRPITQAPNPREAAIRTIDEIAQAMAA
ncbi:MAG TPA: orotidine 5'-phosphate decarboxylase / HUMPS family protein [Candidatus Paceibacterota bacterium]|nr:orotidine 5'-phosphate decarboxylase / HUMPS family protein [Candidatus Paceibacterota bacterium]